MMAGAAALAMGGRPIWAAIAEGERLIPFLNDEQPPEIPNQTIWKDLSDWFTPSERLYLVSHYGIPQELNPADWRLEIAGLVDRPRTIDYEQLRQMPRVEHVATIECGGNGVSAGFMGAIGNIRWTGTPLMPLLRSCGVGPDAIEAVFFGRDRGEEEIRGETYPQYFARSLPLDRAVIERALVCYELNGEPLDLIHGAPVRLVVPGWYGVAWVKWLRRIELIDRRFVGRFMSRDYVTLRGREEGDETVWHRSLVGPMNIKSIVGRVVRQVDGNLRVFGAAWGDGTPLRAVQVKIDDGPWVDAAIDPKPVDTPYAWSFWRYIWRDAAPGRHTVVSRAIDVKGRVQPAAGDDAIRLKKTYWEANQQVVRELEL